VLQKHEVRRAVEAATAVAARLGLDVREPRLIRDLTNVIVHLAPAPYVARVAESGTFAAAERELALVGRLANGGAAVAGPTSSVHPGPYAHDGFVVTLWDYVEHDLETRRDARSAGAALRVIHELLETAATTGLDHFLRADRTERLLGSLTLPAEEMRILRAGLESGRAFAGKLDVPLQPIHGDAHLANVLRSPAGPVWSDFEHVCLGPRELDLACNEIRARHRGREAADDAFLGGYGDHDRELVAALLPVHAVSLATLAFAAAERHPHVLSLARERLAWVREAL
jgi:Ser/Thr protein kinase RdoA (MazF antagonist)